MLKYYVVLYTCSSTRGVILDVVQNTEAKVFVKSFSRFIAMRGCPVTVLLDNGSAFIAQETKSFVSSKNIEWRFNLGQQILIIFDVDK